MELKTWCQKEKLLVLSNFFFCCHVFKNSSAAETLESVYMWERVKVSFSQCLQKLYCIDQEIWKINPFPPADMFWHNSSRWLLNKLWTKVKLLMMSNLIWPQCFQLYLKLSYLFGRFFRFLSLLLAPLASLCHGELSLMRTCVRQLFASNNFSSLTTWPIGMKLHRKHPLNVLS